MKYPLIIRVCKQKDLILSQNKEGIYFLWQYGQLIFNHKEYNIVSDYYNMIEREAIL